MRKIFILLIFSLMTFVSCHKIIDGPDCDIAAKVDTELHQNGPNHPVKIIAVSLDHDCLQIELSAAGCTGNDWKVDLVSAEGYAKPIPIIRDIRVSLEDLGLCQASWQNTFTFNLVDLQVEGERKMELNIDGWDDKILYEY